MDNSSQSKLQLLTQLTCEKCNGTLTEEGVEQLSELLESSRALRKHYWELMSVHSQLSWDLGGVSPKETSDFASAKSLFPSNLLLRSPLVWVASAGCAILLLVGLFVFSNTGGDQDERRFASGVSVAGVELGEVRAMSPEASWRFDQGNANKFKLRQGDTLRLDTGAVELLLESGTSAVIESPAVIEMASLERIRLLSGVVKIDVPEGASGLSVETASMEILDIGTVYSVNYSDGNTEVVVFDGDVDLSMVEADSGLAEKKPFKRISAGEAAQVAKDGTLSRIVSVRQTRNQTHRIGALTPSVIGEVKDNIARDQCLNFYEIVAGGMGEDVQAFVDRPHQWNGNDKDGMPAYLIGGDYVKTFNNDKVANGPPNRSYA